MTPDPRISGKLGSPIDLNVTFYRNGVPTDPFAIRRISIYRSAVAEENLVAQIPIISPCETGYPTPLTREMDSSGTVAPGVFHYIWDVPCDLPCPDIFFDVWEYVTVCPSQSSGSNPCDDPAVQAVLDDETKWQRSCNEFWLYPDGMYVDNGLENIRLGFEAMDVRFYQPERRTLEVGMMPLPLYDFNYNLIAPVIPRLVATFTLSTENCEVLIDQEPMSIGLRQGTYRSCPFVLKYLLDTSRVLKGTYKYRVAVQLPNGETRVSPDFYLQVS